MIREATLDDLEPLMELVKEFHYATNRKKYASFEDSVQGWLQWVSKCILEPGPLCLVAESEGKAVGFLLGFPSQMYWNPAVKVFLETAMWVTPDFRSMGLGGKLVDEMVAHAKRLGIDIVFGGATTEYNTKKTSQLWLSKGFHMAEKHFMLRIE